LLGIESKNTLQTTDIFQQTPQVVAVNNSEKESIAPLYKEDILKKDLCSAICECYPEIQKLNIAIIPIKIYIGNGKYDDKYYLNVTWENGVNECFIHPIVTYVLNDYLSNAQELVSRSVIKPQLVRMYTEDVILQVGQKFADCIAPGLPINMHNIYCFKLGGVSIHELAIGELKLMSEIKHKEVNA
jgi:hypothetical protein